VTKLHRIMVVMAICAVVLHVSGIVYFADRPVVGVFAALLPTIVLVMNVLFERILPQRRPDGTVIPPRKLNPWFATAMMLQTPLYLALVAFLNIEAMSSAAQWLKTSTAEYVAALGIVFGGIGLVITGIAKFVDSLTKIKKGVEELTSLGKPAPKPKPRERFRPPPRYR
jgi:hypothetical protein